MRYASGHERIGIMDNDEWTGEAVYLERHPHGTLKWSEQWANGTYSPSVKILKHVRNRYYEITVTVSCKAHAQRPKAVLYKEGRRVEVARSETKGEINTAVDKLPFSDESFKVWSCRAANRDGSDATNRFGVIERKLRVKNPFFMESHGECGLAQMGLRRTRRGADDARDVRLPRIVAGRDALVGEVLYAPTVIKTRSFEILKTVIRR